MAETRIRPVAGFGGYFVSDDGVVFRRLSPQPQVRSGHMTVAFQLRGKQIRKRVHRLVLEAFVGPAPEGMECLHRDGDPRNNRLGNLHWGTRKENHDDMVRHGRAYYPSPYGRNQPTKLTDDQVVQIRSLRKSGVLLKDIARRYGIAVSTTWGIINFVRRRTRLEGLLRGTPWEPEVKGSERDR